MKSEMPSTKTIYFHSINDYELLAYSKEEFKKLMREYKFTIKYSHFDFENDAFCYDIVKMEKKDPKNINKKQVSIIA